MKAARFLLGFVFILAGVLHFLRPKPYEQMMPEWLPLHREAVLISGVAEAAGGMALLADRSARAGCWWLVATLLAVFPANVHMAMEPDKVAFLRGGRIPGWLLWVRLPLQPLLIVLLLLVTRRSLTSD